MTTVRSLDTDEPAHGPHDLFLQHGLPTKRDLSAALQLLHVLSSDPRGQADIHTFFKELAGNGFHTQSRAYRHIVVYGRRRGHLSAGYIRVLHARCDST
jgi:hypothetical protein